VAVSIFPLYDIARRVAGDRVAVDLVLPPGRFDHDFEPRPQDFTRFSDARLVVLVGLGLDGWGARIARGTSGAEVLELGPQLSPVPLDAGPLEGKAGGARGLDPHVWLDPVRMAQSAEILAEAYARIDPSDSDGFKARARGVGDSLASLNEELSVRLKPLRQIPIVTFHGSWAYFAARYGLEIAGVVEVSPGREPPPGYLRDLLKLVRDRRVKALFSEPQLSRRPVEVIAQEAGVPIYEVDAIGGTPGLESYEALLRHDAGVFEGALR
jgi:ABC-type Zn uptake system ZnuABC Zn-binding protein ZnuA